MLALTPATRIFVAVAPVDLRRSFDGLSAHVQTVLAQEVLAGGLFVSVRGRGGRRERQTLLDWRAWTEGPGEDEQRRAACAYLGRSVRASGWALAHSRGVSEGMSRFFNWGSRVSTSLRYLAGSIR